MDPLVQLTQLAKKERVPLETVSLGQGQGAKAMVKVLLAAEKGNWVFLQNCHLASSWMDELDVMFRE